MTRAAAFVSLTLLAGLFISEALAVEIFARDLAGFEAAAGPMAVQDFEGIPPGTDITDSVISGLHFGNADGAPLIVVLAEETYSSGVGGPEHRLIATTPVNVLSPGGEELPFEGPMQNDDLVLTFSPPVDAFGLDFLWQSADYNPSTSIVVYDEEGLPLFNGIPEITDLGGAGAPAGTDFWGIVSLSQPIASVHIDEQDDGDAYPDSNIGFDTIRVSFSTDVPELSEYQSWSTIKALYQ